jgi:hypothetical protein
VRTRLAGAALLVALTLAVFWRVQQADFLLYDDDVYVTGNDAVRAGLDAGSVRWAFSETLVGNWHPLTWLSHMLDVELYGLDPAGHHRTSLLLHAANAVVLFLLLTSWTAAPARSLLVAALFAVHPLHVESVAWVSERKDVLSMLLALLALAGWTRWTRAGGPAWYAAALACFALALLAKPMVVTLPFALLLLDLWPLGRWTGGARTLAPRVVEKLPFFALSAASSAVTLWAQSSWGSVYPVPLATRLLSALLGYAAYLRQTLWPLDLAVFYPFARAVHLEHLVAAAAILAGVSALAVASVRRRPYLFVGWFWFVGTLVPVIGLVQVGLQARADRYTYLPHVGLFVAGVWATGDLLARLRAGRLPATGLALASVATCAALSARQVEAWLDHRALFEHALAVTEGNYVAHHQLGRWHLARDERDAAIEHLSEAARLGPSHAPSQLLLAGELLTRREAERAAWHYDQVLAYEPSNAAALNGKGAALGLQGRLAEAIRFFGAAVAAQPGNERYYGNLRAAIAESRRRGAQALPPEARLLRQEDREALGGR